VTDYKYDVAFSFLGADEDLATSICDRLEGRVSTFIYSRKQEELAGTDGSETFDRVFGEESRVVVLVFSAGWGERGWTSIENHAIQRRGLKHGWDFLLVLPVDLVHPPIPKFIPPLHIYFDWHRHGLEGACDVIEAHVKRGGGEPEEPTFEALALKKQRALELSQARAAFTGSDACEKWAALEASNVRTIIKNKASQSPLKIEFRDESMLNLYGPRRAYMAVGWIIRPDRKGMHFAGVLNKPGGNPLGEIEGFTPDLDSFGKPAWRGKDGRAFNTSQLADHMLKRLVSAVGEEATGT